MDTSDLSHLMPVELLDVELRVHAELGRTRMSLERAVALPDGAVVDLDRAVEAPIDVYVNGRRFALGHLEVVDGEWAVRLDAVGVPEDGAQDPDEEFHAFQADVLVPPVEEPIAEDPQAIADRTMAAARAAAVETPAEDPQAIADRAMAAARAAAAETPAEDAQAAADRAIAAARAAAEGLGAQAPDRSGR